MSRPTISLPAVADVGDGGVGLGLVGERAAGSPCGRSRPRRSAPARSQLGRQLVHARGRGRRERDAGRRHHRRRLRRSPLSTSAAAADQRPQTHLRASAHHRYSLSLGHNPSATAIAATTDSTAAPTVAPDSTRRALRMSLRNWLRLSSMPLVSAVVELVERGRRVVLAGAERHLRGGLVVADRDVGVDPVVGRPPPLQQLFGVGQVALVDRVVAGQVVGQLLLHRVDALVVGLLADVLVAAPDQRQRLVGTRLLRGDREVGDGLEGLSRGVSSRCGCRRSR